MTNEQTQADNEQMKAQLTKRNLQYIQEVEKQLKLQNYSEAQLTTKIEEMCTKILEKQKQGITARQLFNATPTEYVRSLNTKPERGGSRQEEGEASRLWIGIDGGLLIFGVMMLVTGLTSLFQKNSGNVDQLGLLVLILTGVLGGFAMIIFRKYAQEMKRGSKGGTARYILVALGIVVAWMIIMTVVQAFIPKQINIPVNPIAAVIIGAIAIAARFYVKKKKNIPSI